MKLLDKSGSEVAELLIGDARVVNWDKAMSLIYHGDFSYDEKTGDLNAKEFTVRKIESLDSFSVVTDAGKTVELKGSEEDIMKALFSVGVATGFRSYGVGNEISVEAKKRFREEDEDDVDNINIELVYNAPVEGDYPTSKKLRYPRSANAVTYSDLIKLVDFKVEGYSVTGLTSVDKNGKERPLVHNAKILSDCKINVKWTKNPEPQVDPNAGNQDPDPNSGAGNNG